MVKVAKNKAAIITILLGLRGPSMRQRGGLNLDRPPLRSRPGPGCRSAKEGATESRWASRLSWHTRDYPGRGASIGRLLALVIWIENMSHMSKSVKYVYSS